MRVEEKKRRNRSDKKRDVKPTVPIALKECIERLSYITRLPVKDISEEICEYGLYNKKVMEYLAENFRRSYRFNRTVFMGSLERPSMQKETIKGFKDRITVRFKQTTYEDINRLAYALDVTPTRATAILLNATIRNSEFINTFLEKNIVNKLDPNRQKELKSVLRFINRNNPYDKEITVSALIAYYFDEIKTGLISFQDFVEKLKN